MTPVLPSTSVYSQDTDSLSADQLYQAHHAHIFRFIWSRLHDVQQAEDLTGEVFYRMVSHLPGYRQRDIPFRAWLYRIARNLLIDHHRKERITHAPIETAEKKAGEVSAEERVETLLTLARVQQALTTLEPQLREAVELRFLAGLSLEEVALTMDKSVAAVKALQHRGLVALRARLKE
ncbi:MAG: RNA polymerase sigma factor [Chloroflexota bacterium]